MNNNTVNDFNVSAGHGVLIAVTVISSVLALVFCCCYCLNEIIASGYVQQKPQRPPSK